jgi:hypothetical protein
MRQAERKKRLNPLTTKDESCNRNTDIKKGGTRKEKKEETSKCGGDY